MESVESIAKGNAASSNSVGQVIQSTCYVNTQTELPKSLEQQLKQTVCQPHNQLSLAQPNGQFPVPPAQPQSIQQPMFTTMSGQLQLGGFRNSSILHQNQRRGQPNMLMKQQMQLNEHNIATSYQLPLVEQSSYFERQTQHSMVGSHQHSMHIVQQPVVTPPRHNLDPIQMHQLTSHHPKSSSVQAQVDSISLAKRDYMAEWVKLQVLREKILPDILESYKKVSELCLKPQSGELMDTCEKERSFMETIIKFLKFNKIDLVRCSEDVVCDRFKMVDRYIEFARSKHLSTAIQQHEQLHQPGGHSALSQLHQNIINMGVQFNPFQQGVKRTDVCSPQSLTQQGDLQTQENVINLLQNRPLVRSGISTKGKSASRNSSSRSKQHLSSHAQQTNMIPSHNNGFQIGLEPRNISALQHGSVKTVLQNTLTSQQMMSDLNEMNHTRVFIPPSCAINSPYHTNQKLKFGMPQLENMKQAMQQPLNEMNKQHTMMQKRFGLHQHLPEIQPKGHSPQSPASSLTRSHERQPPGISLVSYVEKADPPETPFGHAEHAQTTFQNQPLASGTQETSASPLLIEFSKDSSLESYPEKQPIQRLVEVVKTMSSEALSSALQDFHAVIDMAEAEPSMHSKLGDNIELDFISNRSPSQLNMNRHMNATAVNSLSSPFCRNGSFEGLSGQSSVMKSSTSFRRKKPSIEPNKDLLLEMREINRQLVETFVDEDLDSPKTSDGTIIRCSYAALGTLADNLRLQKMSSPLVPNFLLRIFVPSSYPNSSPKILDILPDQWSENAEDVITKLKEKVDLSLRTLSEPMSLGEMAKTWDASARTVFVEFAEQIGGKTFSSRFGAWKKCITSS